MRIFTAHRIIAVLATIALAAVVFLNGFGTFHTDIKPELYIRPTKMLGHYLSSWTSTPYLGSPNFNVGLLPILGVLAALRELGLSPELTFKLLHFTLFLLGAVGVSRLTRHVVPSAGTWTPFVAAVLFVANPYTITAGATLAILLPMALLPWQLLCLVHALERPKSWAWPGLFGLTFFFMTGMNVAVVPVLGLLAVIPVVAALVVDGTVTLGNAIRVVGKAAMFVVGVSVYWLIPAFSAVTTGNQIIEGSETMDGIAKVSSMTEVLRGLGLWPLYGSSSIGPWVPEHAVYVMSPLIMMLTMAWPALALLGMRWAERRTRVFVVVAMVTSAFVAVGVFPSEKNPASPLGVFLNWLLHLPLLASMRTTNKIGAILTIAVAIGVAVALVKLVPKGFNFVPARISTVVVVATLLTAWSLPAITGNLYISPLDIPEYWEEAASSVDGSEQPGTVLVLPGQVRPNYRWTKDRPDDILNSVLDRRAVIPETTPNSSPTAVNFLAALDSSFQSGTAAEDLVSTMARYLGAGQVLLRHDVVWEETGGARPAQTSQQIGSDPGLFGRENFGKNGENTLSPAMEDPFFFGEQFLPPLQVYDVVRASNPVRAMGLGGSLLVAGDGFSFASMTEAGLLERTPVVRYAKDLEGSAFVKALKETSRLVLTDTNARRNVIDTRLTVGQGPLLRADEELGSTRTLGVNTNDQTVRQDEVISVSTSSSGGIFFDLPFGAGQFAFDGDLSTGWRFGDFSTGVGESITGRFDDDVVVDRVSLAQLPIGSQKIDEVVVTVGGQSKAVKLPDSGVVHVDFESVTAKSVHVEVKSLRGEGFNFVSIAEINVNGLRAEPVARLPLTFQDRWEELSAQDKERFAVLPLDVLLTRVENTSSLGDDSEVTLDRRFTLQQDREYEVRAKVRAAGDLEPLYDRVAGWTDEVTVRSSGYWFDNPKVRASAAMDGDSATGWIPGGGTRDSWWEVSGPVTDIDQVVIIQEEQKANPGQQTHTISQIAIEVDGERVVQAPLRVGQNRISIPGKISGSTVRVVATGVDGDPSGLPPKLTDIDTGMSLVKGTGDQADCLDVAVVDNGVLRMRPTDRTLAGPSTAGTWWESCGTVELEEGEHRVRQANNFTIDFMEWSDTLNPPKSAALTPAARVDFDKDGHKRISVLGASGPYAIVAGQGYNENWKATIDGKDLGPAQVVNGYSSGWIVEDGKIGTVNIVYAPQRAASVGLGISGLVLLSVLVLVGLAAREGTLMAVPESPKHGSSGLVSRLSAPQQRVLAEVAFVLVASLLGGLAGLGAAGIFVLVQRRRSLSADSWLVIGSGAVVLSMAVHLVVLASNGLLWEVSADSIALSPWPHRLATAGLLWAAAAALVKHRTDLEGR